MSRTFAKAVAALAVIVAVAGAGGYYVRRSLPVYDGMVTVPDRPVRLRSCATDESAHLRRQRLDALFGLGYVHAQDRCGRWNSSAASVRPVSEIFGSATIQIVLRTVGFGGRKCRVGRTSPWARQQVDAYVSGDSSAHHGAAAPGFRCSASSPSRSRVRIVVWVKMMAWDLSANIPLNSPG